MDLSMDLWHSNNMKVILCKFAKGDCLNISFFVMILTIWLTIKPNLKFYSEISEKHDKTSIFAERVP